MKNLKLFRNINNLDFLRLAEKVLVGIAVVMPFTTAFALLPNANGAACTLLQGLNCSAFGPNDIIIKIINIALAVAFLIAVLFLIYGGFRYIFSAGNEEGAEAGRKTVINALIGIVIIILSYVIVAVVANTVSSVGGNSVSSSGGPTG